MESNHIIKRWILVSIGGLFLSGLVQGIAHEMLPQLLPDTPVMKLFPLDFSLGLTVGGLQALVLRRYIVRAWIWAIATGIGMTIAEALAGFILHDNMGLEFGFYRSPLPEALASLAIVGVSIGVCVGGAQWIVFFQAGYKFRSLLWIPVTTIGFTAAFGIGDYFAVPEAFIASFLGMLVGFSLGAVFYGLLTGLLLTWLISSQPNLTNK